jgi:hypothetical protein
MPAEEPHPLAESIHEQERAHDRRGKEADDRRQPSPPAFSQTGCSVRPVYDAIVDQTIPLVAGGPARVIFELPSQLAEISVAGQERV